VSRRRSILNLGMRQGFFMYGIEYPTSPFDRFDELTASKLRAMRGYTLLFIHPPYGGLLVRCIKNPV